MRLSFEEPQCFLSVSTMNINTKGIQNIATQNKKNPSMIFEYLNSLTIIIYSPQYTHILSICQLDNKKPRNNSIRGFCAILRAYSAVFGSSAASVSG